MVKISVAKAHKFEGNQIIKWSFHFVLNIACDKELNKFLAERWALKYDKGVIDLGVYNKNSSLRLPFTPKLNKNNN